MEKGTFLVREVETDATRCYVYLKHKKAGFYFPLHWHDYIEFEVLLSGHGKHVFNGQEYEIRSGDCWLMSYCDFHAVTLDTDSEIIQIGFNSGFLLPEIEAQVATRGFCNRFDEKTMKEVREICCTLDTEKRGKASYLFASQKALVNRLAILLLRDAKREEGIATSPEIGQVLAYIHKNFREDLSMKTLAEIHGFSPNYFGNLFRATVGMSFRDYLNKVRLKYACGLLTSSTLSIKEVAFSSGYLSIEHFFYVFKKNLGMTPTEYRSDH